MCLEIPGIYRGGRYEALCEAITDPIDEIFESYGIKFIACFPQDTMSLIGQDIVDDPSNDLKGLKVRVSGAIAGDTVEKWGAVPVNIAINDVPTALERKTVDSVLSTWIACDGFALWENAPYITMTEMQEAFCGLAMNLDAWNSLTEDQQAAIMRAAETYQTEGYKVAQERKASFLEKMEQNDVTVYNSTDKNNDYYTKIAWEIAEEEVLPNANDKAKKLINAISVFALQ